MAKIVKKEYPQCPKYDGVAVCVDCTPEEDMTDPTSGKTRKVFYYVFEVPLKRDDGKNHIVRSKPFTLSWNEKASLRKFLPDWMGYTMTQKQVDDWDNEERVGKCARIAVRQEPSKKDPSKIYATLKLCEATDEVMAPSGTYVRVKDRKDGDAQRTGTASYTPAAGEDLQTVKIHVGNHAGSELRDLSEDQVLRLIEKWRPTVLKLEKPSADDRRLLAALAQWETNQANKSDNGGEEEGGDDAAY